MNIVHVISGLKIGGAERVLYTLASSLKDAGFNQTIVYCNDGPFVDAFLAIDIPTICIFAQGGPINPLWWWRLRKIIKKINPDLIHASLWLGNLAGRVIGKLLKIPVLCTLHNNHDQNGLMRNGIDHLTLCMADEIVAVSHGIIRTMKQYHFFCADRVHVITNGIANDIKYGCYQDKINWIQELQKTKFIFGSVGRLVPLKRYDFLLAAFAQLNRQMPMTHLILIGDGPCFQALKDQIYTLGLGDRVTLIGDQDAKVYYPYFDCFIQSSRKEGVSLALLEAMAFGIACIVTNQELVHDVITHEKDGLLIAADDMSCLVDRMSCLIIDTDKRQQLGKNALDTVAQRFTLERMVDQYCQLYRSMLSKK